LLRAKLSYNISDKINVPFRRIMPFGGLCPSEDYAL
jgi:hypothetical protein